MEMNIAPAVIQILNGEYCDGAGEQITNQKVLDTLPLEPYVFHGADLNKLDADLHLIDEGKLDVVLAEDTYDYSAHQWESPKGRQIGKILAEVEAEELRVTAAEQSAALACCVCPEYHCHKYRQDCQKNKINV